MSQMLQMRYILDATGIPDSPTVKLETWKKIAWTIKIGECLEPKDTSENSSDPIPSTCRLSDGIWSRTPHAVKIAKIYATLFAKKSCRKAALLLEEYSELQLCNFSPQNREIYFWTWAALIMQARPFFISRAIDFPILLQHSEPGKQTPEMVIA